MKVGDRVKIKSRDWYDANKEVRYGDYVVKCGKENFVSDMTRYCGKETTITRINKAGSIFLDIDPEHFHWTEEMLEPIVSEEIIDIPEGYTIDRIENNKIYIKKNTLPKTWEECFRSLKSLKYIDDWSGIQTIRKTTDPVGYKNAIPENLAKPMLALMQLLVCREVYRQGWKPDWKSRDIKYTIIYKAKAIRPDNSCNSNRILSFQSEEVRDEFLYNFQELITEAKELLLLVSIYASS